MVHLHFSKYICLANLINFSIFRFSRLSLQVPSEAVGWLSYCIASSSLRIVGQTTLHDCQWWSLVGSPFLWKVSLLLWYQTHQCWWWHSCYSWLILINLKWASTHRTLQNHHCFASNEGANSINLVQRDLNLSIIHQRRVLMAEGWWWNLSTAVLGSLSSPDKSVFLILHQTILLYQNTADLLKISLMA